MSGIWAASNEWQTAYHLLTCNLLREVTCDASCIARADWCPHSHADVGKASTISFGDDEKLEGEDVIFQNGYVQVVRTVSAVRSTSRLHGGQL